MILNSVIRGGGTTYTDYDLTDKSVSITPNDTYSKQGWFCFVAEMTYPNYIIAGKYRFKEYAFCPWCKIQSTSRTLYVLDVYDGDSTCTMLANWFKNNLPSDIPNGSYNFSFSGLGKVTGATTNSDIYCMRLTKNGSTYTVTNPEYMSFISESSGARSAQLLQFIPGSKM